MENKYKLREIWMPIIGYNNKYMASNLGRIKSLWRKKEIIMKQREKNNGYMIVNLSDGERVVTRHVHRLVAEAHIGLLPDGITINHKDFNKKNNHIDNLELMSIKENIRHSFQNNRRTEPDRSGSKNGRAKLSEFDIIEIRENNYTAKEICSKYNISLTVAYNIRNNKLWKNV